jgi:hypothetical protein
VVKIPVKFTELELWAIAELAKRRNKNKVDHGVESTKIDKWISDEGIHYIGIKAEYAVSKLLDAELNTSNILSGDPGFDFYYRGITVDVKYSQLDFKFRPGTFKADVAVLVQPLSNGVYQYGGRTIEAEVDKRVKKKKFAWKHVLVVGWISRQRFEKDKKIRNFGYGDTEFLPFTQASSMSMLKRYADGLSKEGLDVHKITA